MHHLATILKGLKEQSGAAAALIASADGLLLEAVDDAGVDLESLAAYAASSVMVSERLGETTAFGGPEAVVLLYRGRPLVITPVGPVIVVLVGTPRTPAGALRMHIRHATVDLVAAVQDELQAPPASRGSAGPAAAVS